MNIDIYLTKFVGGEVAPVCFKFKKLTDELSRVGSNQTIDEKMSQLKKLKKKISNYGIQMQKITKESTDELVEEKVTEIVKETRKELEKVNKLMDEVYAIMKINQIY
jgi:cell fate (sporulation/competence/biofilm development) regulator YmcA (YheA/YmcA/DUF963 family)